MKTQKYRLLNLGCAHCAAKMEERINRLPQVQEAVITYALKQLKVTAEDPDALLDMITDIVKDSLHNAINNFAIRNDLYGMPDPVF